MSKFLKLASAALIGLAAASSAQAYMVCNSYVSPVVADQVAQVGQNTWSYGFSVTNNSYYANGNAGCKDAATYTAFLLPYFSDASITGITTPTGWAYEILAVDTFSLGHGAQTLKWSTTDLSSGIRGQSDSYFSGRATGQTLAGFGFQANAAPVKSPDAAAYGALMDNLQFGDPALPGSRDARAAGLTKDLGYTPMQTSAVPEPQTLALMMLGLGAAMVAGRRRPG